MVVFNHTSSISVKTTKAKRAGPTLQDCGGRSGAAPVLPVAALPGVLSKMTSTFLKFSEGSDLQNQFADSYGSSQGKCVEEGEENW